MADGVMTRKGSELFAGFRALGLYSNHLPHVLRYHGKHREFYLVTSVGSCFHTYNVKKLGIVAVSNSLSEEISCLAADRMLVFAATGRKMAAFARNKEVVHTYEGHEADIQIILPFGDHVISADRDGVVIVWDLEGEEEYLRLQFDPTQFCVSAMMHPSTYLNKILLGSTQGIMQLWNIKSNKLLYNFPGWSAGVTVLEQSPAVDVVAVGLNSGRIILHNIKYDETVMSFQQDWGPVTCLSFRTDGHQILASGSPLGHVALWDLDTKTLLSQLRNAHHASVAAATFIHHEPLLVTNGADNCIKVWIFDTAGGGARLLRSRQGHSAPPTKIQHHGENGQNILSAGQDGTLNSFSTVHERFNKSLGHGSINKKKTKKKGLSYEEVRLPAISTFACETARQGEWDGIVSCHRGYLATSTWNYHRCTMGSHRLEPERFHRNRALNVHATAVDITSCGNYAVVGLSSGHIDVYNLQSGSHRGQYGDDTAHQGAVRGVCVDGLSQVMVSAGSDRLLKIWHFKSKKLVHCTELPAPPASIKLHRDSNMLAVALDDFTINILDLETKRIVRRFPGHRGQINDMTFSPDGRWLISAAMDCTIRTWDLPSGCLVDCFLVSSAPVCVSMSPTGDYLASAHVDNLGVYLWSNKSLCTMVSLRPLPSDYEPTTVMLPGTCPSQGEDLDEASEEPSGPQDYESPQQLDAKLVTLSLLPESRWKNLLSLDVIKRRNKPKEPPKVPKSAPFFLPTIPGLLPQFSVPAGAETQSKVLSLGVLAQKSPFYLALEDAHRTDIYSEPITLLKQMGPSAIETELRGLSPDMGADAGVLLAFMKMIDSMLQGRRDFDLAQAYLALFLKLHLRQIAVDTVATATLSRLSTRLEETWGELQTAFNKSLCVLAYSKTALL